MLADKTLEGLQAGTEAAIREVLACATTNAATKRARALLALVTHIANNWKAISVLAASQVSNELANVIANPITVLMRCMYDAFIQAAYVAAEFALGESRAADYLDFAAIEKHEFAERVLHGTDRLSKRIAPSWRRAEPNIRSAFQEARSRFIGKGGRLRVHWYSGSLADLADATGNAEPYKWYVSFSNSSVHAGALSVLQGPLVPPGEWRLFAAAAVVCQALRLLIAELGLQVSQENSTFIAEVATDFCDVPEDSVER